MFSGLTNQVSSLFSKNAEEQVPTPPQSATEDGQVQPVAPLESGVENNNADNAEKLRYEKNRCNILNKSFLLLKYHIESSTSSSMSHPYIFLTSSLL